MAPKKRGKKVAPMPKAQQKKVIEKKPKNPLFEKNPKNFGIGSDIQPKRNLSRYVRWPFYVRLQRQRSVLKKRLKIPPPINQFNRTADKNTAKHVFKLLHKYRPETKLQKKNRLLAAAQAKAEKKEVKSEKPFVVKYGLNHVTALIENKKAQLVIIAHDVDPLELVVWLPTLCRKMDVPYVIVKGKARLGTVVHKKTAAALCITAVRPEDKQELAQISQAARAAFNDSDLRKAWGGGIMGHKANAKKAKFEKLKAKEAIKK